MKLITSNLTKLEPQFTWNVGKQLQRKICFKISDLAEVSTLQKSLIKTDLAPNIHTNIPTDDDDDDDNNNNVTKFQKHTKTETSGQNEKSHTHKHAEDSFKENTFKEITSAI